MTPARRRPAHDRSSRPGRLVALGATVTALALATATVGTVGAQADDDTEAEPPPVVIPRGAVDLELLDVSFEVEPGDDIVLTYLLTGDLAGVAELSPPDPDAESEPDTGTGTDTDTDTGTDEAGGGAAGDDDTPLPPPPIALSVAVTNYEPVSTASELELAFGSDVTISSLTPNIDGVLVDDVRPDIEVREDGTAVMRLTIGTDQDPSESDRLRFDEEGLHPIVTEFKIADQVVAAHGTVIDRRDDDLALPTIDLALLTHIADPGPSGTLTDVRADIDALDRTADVAIALDAPLTMSIPPNIARLATETSTRNDLPDAFADDELISTPATPFDVSSAAAVNRIDAFDNQLTFGEDQLKAALPSTPVRRDAWLVTSPISAQAAAELRARAVRYMVMPADLYSSSISEQLPSTDRFVEIDLETGSSMRILVIDELGESLTTEATEEILEEQSAIEWAYATVARLRFGQYDAPFTERDDERSRILATPTLAEPDPRLVLALEQLARRTDVIRFSTTSELTGLTDTQTVDEPLTFPETAGPSLADRLELINLTLVSLASVDSMLPEDDTRFAEWRRQLDGFVSTAYDDETVTAAIDEILAEADVIRSAVIPPEPISFTLTGNEGTIDLTIGNRIDEPITVLLTLSSPRLEFPDGDQLVELPASGSVTVQIPVQARSNGTSSVRVDILTPSGDPIVETVTLKSRVNALTGLGQVLTAGLVLILLTWWFGNWRRRRRLEMEGHPSLQPRPTPDDPDPDDTDPDGDTTTPS